MRRLGLESASAPPQVLAAGPHLNPGATRALNLACNRKRLPADGLPQQLRSLCRAVLARFFCNPPGSGEHFSRERRKRFAWCVCGHHMPAVPLCNIKWNSLQWVRDGGALRSSSGLPVCWVQGFGCAEQEGGASADLVQGSSELFQAAPNEAGEWKAFAATFRSGVLRREAPSLLPPQSEAHVLQLVGKCTSFSHRLPKRLSKKKTPLAKKIISTSNICHIRPFLVSGMGVGSLHWSSGVLC